MTGKKINLCHLSSGNDRKCNRNFPATLKKVLLNLRDKVELGLGEVGAKFILQKLFPRTLAE